MVRQLSVSPGRSAKAFFSHHLGVRYRHRSIITFLSNVCTNRVVKRMQMCVFIFRRLALFANVQSAARGLLVRSFCGRVRVNELIGG